MRTVVLTVLLLALAPWSVAASKRTYPMEVPAAGVRTITFDVQEGDFVLRGDPAATSVRMQLSIDRYWLFKLGEEGILKKLIKVSGEGTPELTIKTDIPRAISNWGRAEYPVDFEIIVPAGALLKVRDTSGKIEISEMKNAVEVSDSSGTLAVRGITGPLRIEKDSGDIRVEDVSGATTIKSHSGQMRLQRLGELEVSESDGNLEVVDIASGRLFSRGGNVRVSGVKRELEIEDDSGEVYVRDVAGAVTIRDTSGQIRAAQVGALTIDDTSGDVVVEGASAVNVRSKESGQVKVRGVSGEVRVPAGITLNRR